jgi:hypothetical protein
MKNQIWLALIITVLIQSCKQSRDFPEEVKITTKLKTEILPTLENKVDLSKNQIYSSALLYAWEEIRKEAKDKININPEFKQLIKIHKSISFQESLLQDEIRNDVVLEDNAIKVRSEFRKSLPFTSEFEKNPSSLVFAGKSVESFGISVWKRELVNQAQILYYINDQSFGVKLKPKENEQEILLLTSPKFKGGSLAELLEEANKIVSKNSVKSKNPRNSWKWEFTGLDRLNIPVLKFNLLKEFTNVAGRPIKLNNQEFRIDEMTQSIALVLDNKGAEIESVAQVDLVTEDEEGEITLPQPKKLIFDKPFLLIFKRKNSLNPYLVAWISNNELMVEEK